MENKVERYPNAKPTPFQQYLPNAFDNELTLVQKFNKMLEAFNILVNQFNVVVDFANEFDEKLKSKEDSKNITDNRKLSPNGDFTGSIHKIPSLELIAQIRSNKDVLQQLTWQFADGYTGQVIDGGFFESGNIRRNYDGGIF